MDRRGKSMLGVALVMAAASAGMTMGGHPITRAEPADPGVRYGRGGAVARFAEMERRRLGGYRGR